MSDDTDILIQKVVLVGGFAASPYVQQVIRQAIGGTYGIPVIVPPTP